jgi:hypothetical protein
MSEITLETKLVGDITGNFFVPSYQRGYRWGKEEVQRLLDDVESNGNKSYCLQPIVVRNNGSSYELIDGQQRLTTLYLIYKYMHQKSNGFIKAPHFVLSYKTREITEDFLSNIDLSRKEEDIDLWFICKAFETISEWFSSKENEPIALTDINTYLGKNVKVIWYEVEISNGEEAIDLFARLNIGKIPLTSAELVKAMFLCRESDEVSSGKNETLKNQLVREKREEISLQWDNIEKELHNERLWSFLTNDATIGYQTRIDLVLDMMARKPVGAKEKYFTFFAFDKMRQTENLDEIWTRIQNTFLILKDWFENHELYHKIGYLIASDTKTLQESYELAQGNTKRKFSADLNDQIMQSIKLKKSANYGDLSYDKKQDYDHISKLLLLFNVESVRQNGEETQWFPFDKFKFEKGNKVTWSLEHIHAQQSEGMRTQDAWKEWLRLHQSSIASLEGNHSVLIDAMSQAIDSERLDRKEFKELQQQVIGLLSTSGSTEFLHSIANLALLSTSDNAALNNSTFDVKRNAIIEMDKAGQYIPFCTKMVFLKYYTPSKYNQMHFWGQPDREAYVDAINRVLKAYLPENITLEKEVQ